MIKVCILTAGTGSRLRPLTENINKAILPLGDKAVISHIIDKFSKSTEFIIATGYLSATVKDYLELAHPEHNFTFVDVEHYSGQGCGPGYSLLQCEPFLQGPSRPMPAEWHPCPQACFRKRCPRASTKFTTSQDAWRRGATARTSWR